MFSEKYGAPYQNFGKEFPRHNFSCLFTGFTRLFLAGKYKFRAHSDNGSNIYIDGQKIVDNMSNHTDGPTEKDSFELNLKQGWYPIWVDYMNSDGPTELDILY